MAEKESDAVADLASLERIFTIPESNGATLAKIDAEISNNLDGFLRDHIVAIEKSMDSIESLFTDSVIPEQPQYIAQYTDFIMENLVAHSVHTSARGFIGHMTSALPYFMLPLSKIVTALNQNLVKVETSKAFTPLERQVLGMLHKLVYEQDSDFYQRSIQDFNSALGVFCSGGTVANLTALWVARNRLLGEQNISRQGLFGAMQSSGYNGLVILVSKRGHYSLGKAVDILGLGRDNLIAVDTDENYRIDLNALEEQIRQVKAQGKAILSIVGVAGATETGSVDPLHALADICERENAHFHVDAAWGGATLFSNRYRHLLDGVERSDSITIDAHKQFYVPMGAGMVLFKNAEHLTAIEHHAEYIIRKGSRDLGSKTLEGSRPGTALMVHAGLHIIGRQGYELLINQGIDKSRMFADLIRQHPDFELIVEPELNILGYRYCPQAIQSELNTADQDRSSAINRILDQLTRHIQKSQRSSGKTFVSRTRVESPKHNGQVVTVFRVVLANPLTSFDVLQSVLSEQLEIAESEQASRFIKDLSEFTGNAQFTD